MARNKYVRQWHRQISVPKEIFLASFHQVITPLSRDWRLVTRSGFGMDKQRDFEGEIRDGQVFIKRVPGLSDRKPVFSLRGEFSNQGGLLTLSIVKQGYVGLAGAIFLFSLIGTVLLWDLSSTSLDNRDLPPFLNISLLIALFLSLSYVGWRAYNW
ncbi:hypothetical protein [Paraflavitalea sp. CAU 1676]|uniref:hypothetical protein n=1 Tax=Paraflavitalea sp. CAU 1676 TaxID=3032598 RepID=UPI0023DBF1D6|nr:hypothetical protein [Paraflavitalea sp. CAU 1676]MDF2188141.1 hypothetical protein [Paraflavitalea sp. CAU 1676]